DAVARRAAEAVLRPVASLPGGAVLRDRIAGVDAYPQRLVGPDVEAQQLVGAHRRVGQASAQGRAQPGTVVIDKPAQAGRIAVVDARLGISPSARLAGRLVAGQRDAHGPIELALFVGNGYALVPVGAVGHEGIAFPVGVGVGVVTVEKGLIPVAVIGGLAV